MIPFQGQSRKCVVLKKTETSYADVGETARDCVGSVIVRWSYKRIAVRHCYHMQYCNIGLKERLLSGVQLVYYHYHYRWNICQNKNQKKRAEWSRSGRSTAALPTVDIRDSFFVTRS